ncbi:MAG: transglutaminase-like domain-containing protein [Bacillota bacterium]
MTKVIRTVATVAALAAFLLAMPGMAAAAEEVAVAGKATEPAAVAPALEVAPAPAEASETGGEQTSRIVEVRTSFTVRNVLADAARNLTIVVPPSVLSQAGTQKVLDVKFSPEPTSTRQTPAGIEATYKVAEVAGFTTLTFEQVYTVELFGTAQPLIEEELDARYLSAERGVESDNGKIRSKALAVTRGLKSTESKVEAIIRFVVDRLEYDLNAPSRNKGALAGFETGVGVCQEYAGLFVAMARSVGIPARLVYGWAQSTGLEGSLNGQNRHVWAEYYDEEKGWIAVDPTFAEVQEDLLAFDNQSHIAQDWTNSTYSASFGGRGLLSIMANQSVTEVQNAPVAADESENTTAKR